MTMESPNPNYNKPVVLPGVDSQFEAFDGTLLHPSLDIKDGLMILGFRYRSKPHEEKDIFIVASGGYIETTDQDPCVVNDRAYYFEKRVRRLASLEEKWSVSALQQFIAEYNSFNIMTVPPNQILKELMEIVKRYTELEQEIDYCLLSAWILGTYFYPVFYAFPFLHIKAPKRSGKSQCLNLLTQLCFNAIKARASTAALGDTVDSLRGTYLIDQADSLERKGGEELLDILADSYKKSGGKRRVMNLEKGKGREILEFETYSPKAFASIRELPEDLRDRCLVVPLIRSQRAFLDPDENNENWHDIRGMMYKQLITNYKTVGISYQQKKAVYRDSKEIIGRSLELWLPFETILHCFGMPERIVEAKKRFLAQYGFTEYEPSELEEAVIKAILIQLQEAREAILTPKAICEQLDVDLFSPADTSKQRASKVGWAIKKFNLSSEKKPRTKEGVSYLFHKQKVEEICKSYIKTDPSLTPPTPTQFNSPIARESLV